MNITIQHYARNFELSKRALTPIDIRKGLKAATIMASSDRDFVYVIPKANFHSKWY